MSGTCSYSSTGTAGAVFLGSNYACCNQTAAYTQDQVCAPFTLPAGTTAGILGGTGTTFSVFAMNLAGQVFSSGYIENSTAGTTYELLATFQLNGATIGGAFNDGVTIPSGGSLAFTATRFDTILVSGLGTAGSTLPVDLTGKFCVTPRYQLS